MAATTENFGSQYETVAASQTDQVMGTTGEKGDYLERLVLFVATAATAAVTLKDGATTIASFANSPGGGIGVYNVPLGIKSANGPFKITTGAGVSVIAIGNFV